MVSKKPEGEWLSGRGHSGLEEEATTAKKKRRKKVSLKAKSAAASRIGSTVSGVSALTNQDRVLGSIQDLLLTSEKDTLTFQKISDHSGQSVPFIQMFFRLHTPILSKAGLSATVSGNEIKFSGAAMDVDNPKATKKAKVKAAPKKEKKVKIEPDLFIFDPLIKLKIEAIIKSCFNFWLAGPTGTGKSEYFERILEKLGKGFVKVSANGESSVDEILGHYAMKDGATIEIKGALELAMEQGVPLIVEEVDAAPAEVNLAFQRVLEIRPGKDRRYYNARFQREIKAQPGFCVLATANTTGAGDHSGLYAGTQVQNAAFRDRFCFEVLDYPDTKTEIAILVKRGGLKRELANRVVKFAQQVRVQVSSGDMATPVSTRTLLAFAMMFDSFVKAGMDISIAAAEAMQSAAIHKAAHEGEKAALQELAQRVFG